MKYRDKVTMVKSDNLFIKELEDIKRERYKNRLDVKPLGLRIFQRKIVRHPTWLSIKNDLKIAKFLPEEDGFMPAFNWFQIIIVAFLAVMLFAGLIYAMGLINDVMHQVGIQNEANYRPNSTWVNMTYAADVTFGQVNNSIQALRMVALTLIFSMIMGAILVNFLVKVHPAFFFIYVLIILLAIIFSAPISNAYLELRQSDIYNGILPSFTGTDWIMLNLPMIVTIGGLLGGIFLFISIIKGEGGEIR